MGEPEIDQPTMGQQEDGEVRLQFKMTQNYLETARAVWVPLQHPTGNTEAFLERYGPGPLANATIAIVSITVIYSYLALEAFCNYQLHGLWKRRHDGSPESQRFLELLGDSGSLEHLRTHERVRNLGARLKTLCELLGYRKPHEVSPQLWQDFKDLAERSRHFLVHPTPSSEVFQQHMLRIGHQVETGKYAHVAGELIAFFYQQAGRVPPRWVRQNTLFTFTGASLLAGDQDARPSV